MSQPFLITSPPPMDPTLLLCPLVLIQLTQHSTEEYFLLFNKAATTSVCSSLTCSSFPEICKLQRIRFVSGYPLKKKKKIKLRPFLHTTTATCCKLEQIVKGDRSTVRSSQGRVSWDGEENRKGWLSSQVPTSG